MKIQQLFVGISSNISVPAIFRKSNVFTILLARNAEYKMLFGKGRQISSAPQEYICHHATAFP